jgi:hypothetical protein
MQLATLHFLGLRQGQPKIVMTSTFPVMGAALFPPLPPPPPGLAPLEGSLDVMNFFIMVQFMSLSMIEYG